MLEILNKYTNFSKKKTILIGIFAWFIMHLFFFLPLNLGAFNTFKADILRVFYLAIVVFLVYRFTAYLVKEYKLFYPL